MATHIFVIFLDQLCLQFYVIIYIILCIVCDNSHLSNIHFIILFIFIIRALIVRKWTWRIRYLYLVHRNSNNIPRFFTARTWLPRGSMFYDLARKTCGALPHNNASLKHYITREMEIHDLKYWSANRLYIAVNLITTNETEDNYAQKKRFSQFHCLS